jgi:hypothetical protein
MTFSPSSSARERRTSSVSRRYRPGAGSPLAQSIQQRMALKPRALICVRSRRHTSFFAPGSASSMGARALPPPYQTAIGKTAGSAATPTAAEADERRTSRRADSMAGVYSRVE